MSEQGRRVHGRGNVMLLAAMAAIGCGQRTFGEGIGRPEQTPVTAPWPSPIDPVQITEVFFGDDVHPPWVELANLTGSPQSLDGGYACIGALCYSFPVGALVAENSRALWFPAGGPTGTAPVDPPDLLWVDVEPGVDFVGTAMVGWLVGDLALVGLSDGTLASPGQIVSFVRIGDSAATVWAERAVTNVPSLWPSVDEFVPVPADATLSLIRADPNATGAAAWVAGRPKPRE